METKLNYNVDDIKIINNFMSKFFNSDIKKVKDNSK